MAFPARSIKRQAPSCEEALRLISRASRSRTEAEVYNGSGGERTGRAGEAGRVMTLHHSVDKPQQKTKRRLQLFYRAIIRHTNSPWVLYDSQRVVDFLPVNSQLHQSIAPMTRIGLVADQAVT